MWDFLHLWGKLRWYFIWGTNNGRIIEWRKNTWNLPHFYFPFDKTCKKIHHQIYHKNPLNFSEIVTFCLNITRSKSKRKYLKKLSSIVLTGSPKENLFAFCEKLKNNFWQSLTKTEKATKEKRLRKSLDYFLMFNFPRLLCISFHGCHSQIFCQQITFQFFFFFFVNFMMLMFIWH